MKFPKKPVIITALCVLFAVAGVFNYRLAIAQIDFNASSSAQTPAPNLIENSANSVSNSPKSSDSTFETQNESKPKTEKIPKPGVTAKSVTGTANTNDTSTTSTVAAIQEIKDPTEGYPNVYQNSQPFSSKSLGIIFSFTGAVMILGSILTWAGFEQMKKAKR